MQQKHGFLACGSYTSYVDGTPSAEWDGTFEWYDWYDKDVLGMSTINYLQCILFHFCQKKMKFSEYLPWQPLQPNEPGVSCVHFFYPRQGKVREELFVCLFSRTLKKCKFCNRLSEISLENSGNLKNTYKFS